MNRLRLLLIVVLGGLSTFAAHAAAPPTPEAQVLIEELGLRASDTPVKDLPGWNPQRVVVLLRSNSGESTEELEAQFRAAAGNVEVEFVKQPGKTLSREVLAGADGVIGVCSPKLFKAADDGLRWIHNYTVGMDYCKGYTDTQLSEIVVTNNQRLSGPAIAEHSIAMLLALSHNLPAYHTAQLQRKWQREHAGDVTFGELKGKTLLVVGLGGIGTQIAWRAHALGMKVIATRNSSRRGPDYVDYVGLSDELHALAARADVIVNALPLTPDTTGIFNKAFFDAAKPGAIFLSVGRGKSTVTADLIAALESGQLSGAGLDVTDPEPLPPSSPLWAMPNVIITPHVSTAGPDSPRRTMIIAVENLRRYVAGEPLLNVVDLERGY